LIRCYDAGIDQLNRAEWLGELLRMEDELFHIAYFQALIEKGEGESLLCLTSRYLEDFLRNDRRGPVRILLWQVYAKRRQYVEAAQDIKLLIQTTTCWDKSEQIEMMRQAANLARLGRDDGLAGEFDLLIKHHECLQQVDGKPPAIAQLYSFAEDGPTDDRDKLKELTKLWRDYMEYLVTKELPGQPDQQLKAIRKLVGKFPATAVVLQPMVMVAPFEDWRWLSLHINRPLLIPQLLVASGISGRKLSDAYVDLIAVVLPQAEQPIPQERIDQLVYATVWLVEHQYGNQEHMQKIRKQIQVAAQRKPFDVNINTCLARISATSR
jgi:hypothetical protein